MRTVLPTRNLDVLRAVAVLCVLVHHVILVLTSETVVLWALGRAGVLLFFVHTALVLMASLERQGDGATQFYIRRAFRIYPLAIVTVLAVVLLRLPRHVVPGDSTAVAVTAKTLVSNLLLVQNLTGADDVLGSLWTLPLELQMYALLPLLYLVACRGVRPTLALMALAVVLSLTVPCVPQLWRLSVFNFAPAFVLGVLLYAWLREGGRVADLPDCRLTRVAHQIATYSYGIYLLHIPALAIAFVWGVRLPQPLQWGLFTVLLLALPVAAYHWIEAPGIALGKRLAAWRPRNRVARIVGIDSDPVGLVPVPVVAGHTAECGEIPQAITG